MSLELNNASIIKSIFSCYKITACQLYFKVMIKSIDFIKGIPGKSNINILM